MVTNAVARTHIKEVVLACEYLLCTNKVFYFEVLVLLSAFIQKTSSSPRQVCAGWLYLYFHFLTNNIV